MLNECTLTIEDFIRAKEFAVKTAKMHKDFSIKRQRDNNQKIENIRIGKLGEIVFRKLKQEEIIDKDPTEDEHACIYDFKLKSGKSVDIKTLNESWKQRVYINFDVHSPADIFVLIIIDEKNKTGKYIGQLTKEEVGKLLKYDVQNDAYYVDKKWFK